VLQKFQSTAFAGTQSKTQAAVEQLMRLFLRVIRTILTPVAHAKITLYGCAGDRIQL
jgi:hypothetical protein